VPKLREIRAQYDDESITVYQAYNPQIAQAATAAGKFVAPFSLDRMTWIKPSFCWMMYRSGWATKLGQERVLAIRISRVGFEWALTHASLSHFENPPYTSYEQWLEAKSCSPVRIQWDPERDIHLNRLDHRSIQIGLSGDAVGAYVHDWTLAIDDITHTVHELADSRDESLLPIGRPYPLSEDLARRIGATLN